MIIQNRFHKKKYEVTPAEWDAIGKAQKSFIVIEQESPAEQTISNSVDTRPVIKENKTNKNKKNTQDENR